MRIMVDGKPYVHAEPDEAVTKIEVWYDRAHWKVWLVTSYNAAGDQVGESLFEHRKADAVRAARKLQGDLGGVDKVTLIVGTR